MNLRERFARFWYVPTIAQMQADMLARVRDIMRRKLLLSRDHTQREIDRMVRIFSPIESPTILDLINSQLGPLETMYADRNGDLHIKKYYRPDDGK